MQDGLELGEHSGRPELPEEDFPNARVPLWMKWGALVAALAAAILILIRSEYAERRAIEEMPAAERQALYARTVQNLNAICSPPEDAMRDFCHHQANLVLEFSECDRSCQALANQQLSRAQLPF